MLVHSPQPLLEAEADRFATDFDRRPFSFGHRLADSPLFEPARLLELAAQMSREPRDVYYDAGKVAVGQRWDQVPVAQTSAAELLARIETADAWIVLFNVQKDPQYAVLLDACIAEIEARAGIDLRKIVKLRQAIVFINSPGRITPFHIDRECSLLLQMRGSKTINIFDRSDREVLTERELERFWTVDNNAPVYKPHLQSRATVLELTPGRGVHLPVNAPHWLQNGPDVSVSLNVNFHYKDHLLGDVYRMNHLMRRVGLRPTPPRQSPILDKIKGDVYSSLRYLRQTGRRTQETSGTID